MGTEYEGEFEMKISSTTTVTNSAVVILDNPYPQA
jgi:hypothetical protein